jgi:single-stranded DNA-binding protein
MTQEGIAISFAGNLTDDPEIRYTESSMPEG